MGQLIRSLELESLTKRPKDGSVRDVRDIARLLDGKDLSRQPLGESTRFRTTLYAEQIHGSPNTGIMHKAERGSVTRVATNFLVELSEMVRRGLCHPHITLARRVNVLQ